MRLILVVAVVLLVGCLSTPQTEVNGSPVHHGTSVMTKNLAWLNYTTVVTAGVSQIGFEVKVPAGGAQRVQWQLGVMNTPGEAYITGPGCTHATPGTVSSSMAIGGYSYTNGPCNDLTEGTYTFHVDITGPTSGYKATVSGDVTVSA